MANDEDEGMDTVFDLLLKTNESCLLALAIGLFAFLLWQNHFLHRQVKDYQEMTEVLRFERDYDMLSGLKNRNAFLRFFQQMESESEPVSVIVCDIDGLKIINDAAGHAAGNKAIQKAGAILRVVCPSDACAFRTGGDEYVIVLKASWSVESMLALKNKIGLAIAAYNKVATNIPLSLSVGFAAADGDAKIRRIYKQADSAMYCEKKSRQEKVYQMLRLALVAVE